MEDKNIKCLTSYLRSLASNEPFVGVSPLECKFERISLTKQNFSENVSEDRVRPERCSNDFNYFDFDDKSKENVLPPVEVLLSDTSGRFMKATRDIEPGESIFWEPPFVLAPKGGFGPTCLECFLSLVEKDWPVCDNCKCPRCKECTEGNEHSREECKILSTAFLGKAIEKDISLVKNLNIVLTPLRTFLTIIENPSHEAVVKTLQSNANERMTYSIGKFIEKYIVPFFTETKLNISSELIHQICGVFDTNAFDVTLGNNRQARALLPLAALMNHSCTPNTQHWFLAGHCVVRASVPIRKGEDVTNNYTQILWNTKNRRSHLKLSKLFICDCLRCKDPTELGTHLSSVLCHSCRTGLCIPPQAETDFWVCSNCEEKMSSSSVANIILIASSIVSRAEEIDTESIYKMLQKLSLMLGKQHSSAVKLHLIYVKKVLENLNTAKANDLVAVLTSVDYLLNITSILDPGVTRIRGLLLLYKIKTLTELIFRKKDQLLNEEGMNALQTKFQTDCCIEKLDKEAEECEFILKWDSVFEDVLKTRQRWITAKKDL